jgi:DNA-directed RNA polymerase specialized sigma24 family protein
MAEHLACRLAGRGEPLEDLVQVATVGLINAVDRFEPDRGSHFLAFAVPTITGELCRHFRDHGWSTRVPRRLKDLSLADRRAQAELSQQLGRSPRPREIAERLGVPVANVLEALHAAEAYRSSSLDALLYCRETTATHQTLLGEDTEIGLIDEREALRPLLGSWHPGNAPSSSCGSFTNSPSARSVSGSASHKCTSPECFARHPHSSSTAWLSRIEHSSQYRRRYRVVNLRHINLVTTAIPGRRQRPRSVP